MDQKDLDAVMAELIGEYEKSGIPMDDFLKAKLAEAGHADADAYVAEIDATLKEIDQKYASLQQHRKNGGNREEWLRGEVDDTVRELPPETAGKVLSSTIKVLNLEEDDTPDENASYNALDAAFMIQELDDALVKNTCAGLGAKEE